MAPPRIYDLVRQCMVAGRVDDIGAGTNNGHGATRALQRPGVGSGVDP